LGVASKRDARDHTIKEGKTVDHKKSLNQKQIDFSWGDGGGGGSLNGGRVHGKKDGGAKKKKDENYALGSGLGKKGKNKFFLRISTKTEEEEEGRKKDF